MDTVTLSPDSAVMRPSIVSPDLVVIASGKNCSQMTNLIDPKRSTRIVVTAASLIFIDAWCLAMGPVGFIGWLGLSLCISDRHAEGHMLAVAHWRHDKDEQCSDKPLTANSLNYAAKKASNRCDKRSTPGNPHRHHCERTAARGAKLLGPSTRWTNAHSLRILYHSARR